MSMRWDFDRLIVGLTPDGEWFISLVKGGFTDKETVMQRAKQINDYLVEHMNDAEEENLEPPDMFDAALHEAIMNLESRKKR